MLVALKIEGLPFSQKNPFLFAYVRQDANVNSEGTRPKFI